jgi:hypothetical protein
VSHVSLITLGVSDVARSSAFYEAVGWRRSPVSTDDVVFLAGGTVVLALWSPALIAEDAHVAAATAAYATNVASEAEVDELLTRASAAGGNVTKPAGPTDWGGYTGYFVDADGHVWEVAHNPGFPLGDDGQVFLPASDDQMADAVLAVLETAWAEIERLTAGDTNNVVLATMLELSRRARSIEPTESGYWRASAASTVISGLHAQRRED